MPDAPPSFITHQQVLDLTSHPLPSSVEDSSPSPSLFNSSFQDFHPQTLYTLDIGSRSEEVFYEDVTEPVEVRLAYFASSKDLRNQEIDFFVVDPERRVIYSRRKQVEGMYRFNASMNG